MQRKDIACWLSVPDVAFIEIASDVGYGTIVFDVEHGTFDLKDLDRLIPLATHCGLDVLVKVEGPRAEPIQQALDFGAAGVVVPHIGNAAHASAICAASKYPPLGSRSFAGGRPVRYDVPADSYCDDDNRKTRCFAMVETAEALADVEKIVALPTVDGVFVGPSDLSLTRGRGKYRYTEADRADLTRIVEGCLHAGKPWIMPAWRVEEQAFAKQHGAAIIVVAEQQGAMAMGLKAALGRLP